MIARNDLLETKKDSLAGCVMNTATIIVDIFITCTNTCKDIELQKASIHRDQKYYTTVIYDGVEGFEK